MNLKLLLELIGGWRATAFLALFLGTALALGVVSYQKSNLETKIEAKEMALKLDKAKYEAWKSEIETNHADAFLALERKLKGENDKAQEELDKLNLDRRNGTLVLRDKFKCPIYAPGTASTVPSVPGVNGTSYSILSPEDEEFLISEAKRGDYYARQVNGLIETVKVYQKSCGVKK